MKIQKFSKITVLKKTSKSDNEESFVIHTKEKMEELIKKQNKRLGINCGFNSC